MTDAKRDSNQVTTLLAVSSVDGVTPVTLYADPITHRLLIDFAPAGSDATTALDNLASVAINAALVLGTSDAFALGSATKMWSDLFLASGAVINFNNGDVTITHAANALAFAGGTVSFDATPTVGGSAVYYAGGTDIAVADGGTGLSTIAALSLLVANSANTFVALTPGAGNSIRINAGATAWEAYTPSVSGATVALDNLSAVAINVALLLGTSDAFALGSATKMWADLFLASGAVINFNNGDVTLTHGTDVLTLGGGDLAIGANNITITGSIGATAARSTKLWATDIESTNMPTVGGTAILTSLTAPQFTTIELGHASDTTLSRVSAGVAAIEGVNILTVAGGTLTGNLQLGENTSIDLDPAGSADGKYSGVCITGTAGATLAFGDLIYLAVADSRWELCDADAVATAGNILIGMCVLAAAGDASATKILLMGQIRADAKFPALTIGAAVYASDVTAGAIQVAIPTGADNVIRVVGFAMTADEIYFNPSQDHQTTVA